MNDFNTHRNNISEIKRRLRDGESKKEVLESYADRSNDEYLRKLLASIPDLELAAKYNRLHKVALSLIGLVLVFQFFGLITNFTMRDLLSFAVTLLIAYRIFQFEGTAYLPAVLWFALSIFNLLRELTKSVNDPFTFQFAWFFSLVFIVLIGLLLFIWKRVFPYFAWFWPAKDEHGRSRFD